ncbi:MAG: molybdate ABC transporter substrate-binding protein, partial [Acidimicrobiales bacterium]
MRKNLLAALWGVGILAAGCGDDDVDNTTTTSTRTETPAVEGDITVFAAASHTDTFTEIGEAFEAANAGA